MFFHVAAGVCVGAVGLWPPRMMYCKHKRLRYLSWALFGAGLFLGVKL